MPPLPSDLRPCSSRRLSSRDPRLGPHRARFICRGLAFAAVALAASATSFAEAARSAAAAEAGRSTQSLAGRWQFALDPKDEGVAARWYERDLGDTIELPGTTEE